MLTRARKWLHKQRTHALTHTRARALGCQCRCQWSWTAVHNRWLIFNFISRGGVTGKRHKSLQHLERGGGFGEGRHPSVANSIWWRHIKPSSLFLSLPFLFHALVPEPSIRCWLHRTKSKCACASRGAVGTQSCASRLIYFMFSKRCGFLSIPTYPPSCLCFLPSSENFELKGPALRAG